MNRPGGSFTTAAIYIGFLALCLSDDTVRPSVLKIGKSMCPVAIALYNTDKIGVIVAQANHILHKLYTDSAYYPSLALYSRSVCQYPACGRHEC